LHPGGVGRVGLGGGFGRGTAGRGEFRPGRTWRKRSAAGGGPCLRRWARCGRLFRGCCSARSPYRGVREMERARLAVGARVVRGVLRPVSEATRLLRKRRRTLLKADRLLWRIGVLGLVLAAVLMVAVVPLGSAVLLDLDVGVVWFNAMDDAVWACVWLTGWGA